MQTIVNIARAGSIGDVIATSTVICGLKKKYPQCDIHYYTKCHNAANLIDGVDIVLDSSLWNNRSVGVDCLMHGYPYNEGHPIFPMKRHLLEYYADNAGVCPGEFSLKPLSQNLTKERIITFHIKTGWSIYKEWDMERWNQVIQQLKPLLKDTKLVQLGTSSDTQLKNIDIDLRGKTSLKQSCALIKDSILHVGVDSFSNHVAGGLKKKAIILFGSTSPVNLGYPTSVNIWKQLSCSPCYKENPEISHEEQRPCNHKSCMKNITVTEVMQAILKQLGDKK
jgi:ADP-heptose:LPS heptosyltransferase